MTSTDTLITVGNYIPSSFRGGEKGQVLLIVVLAMIVALTVGLSVAARSIIDLRIATDEGDSQKAFSAAEAGIEQAQKISIPADPSTPVIEQKEIGEAIIESVFVSPVSGSEFPILGGNFVQKDDGADIWLVRHNDDGSLNTADTPWDGAVSVYWGDTDDGDGCKTAAVELIVVENGFSDPQTRRYTFDPCNARQQSNNFTPTSLLTPLESVEGKEYYYKTRIPPNGDPITITDGILLRVTPLYFDAKIAVKKASGSPDFPVQGKKIEAVGSAGDTVRKLVYYQGYLKVPVELFNYVHFTAQ